MGVYIGGISITLSICSITDVWYIFFPSHLLNIYDTTENKILPLKKSFQRKPIISDYPDLSFTHTHTGVYIYACPVHEYIYLNIPKFGRDTLLYAG